jgi:hypothetical protein
MNKNTTKDVTYKIVNLTPETAKKLLAKNTHNRNVAQNRVDIWAQSMERGEWVLNGQPILIATDGTILDGQHRLLACVQSGITIPVVIGFNVSKSAQDTMDTGRSRSLADVLKLHGEKNSVELAAMLNALLRWKKYGVSYAFNNSTINVGVTNGEAIKFLEENPGLREVPAIVEPAAKNAYITRKICCTLYVKFREADPEAVDEFFVGLSTGNNLEDGSPIISVRKTLKNLHDQKGSYDGTTNRYVAAILVKAWNAFVNGQKVRQIRFSTSGSTKERFPEIQSSIDSQLNGLETL